MSKLWIIVLSSFLISIYAHPVDGLPRVRSFRAPRFPASYCGSASDHLRLPNDVAKGYNYTTKYFTQVLDHFSFSPGSYSTFQQRYLINDEHWLRGGNGPIFLYAGNEGYIDWFANNTGFMWDIAEEFGALLLFPEHRYYGESVPFGSREAAYQNASMLAYLTAEQALADFARLVVDLKRNLSAEASPVVTFGGSYGGMLATWFRLKYPHVTVGALASSAPILQFEDIVPQDIFYKIVSQDFKMESQSCFDTIRSSWAVIDKEAEAPDGLQSLSKKFRLCRPLASAQELKDWISEAFSFLGMVDYPIAASFIAPLPAFPVREVCKQVDGLPAGSGVLDRLFAGISVFYNYSGAADCFQTGEDSHGMAGWQYQACTEMVMPMTSNPENSMFEASQWDPDAFADSCQEAFGVRPRPHWIPTQFGGRNIRAALKTFGSNIVFANGLLDPWSGGGVLEDISDTVVAIVMKNGAHHLDLRAATPDDPYEVTYARVMEKHHIRKWIRQANGEIETFTATLTLLLITGIVLSTLIGRSLLATWTKLGVLQQTRKGNEYHGLAEAVSAPL